MLLKSKGAEDIVNIIIRFRAIKWLVASDFSRKGKLLLLREGVLWTFGIVRINS